MFAKLTGVAKQGINFITRNQIVLRSEAKTAGWRCHKEVEVASMAWAAAGTAEEMV
jgi:hypothetical protein